MWLLFFVIGIILSVALLIHINLEINTIAKTTDSLFIELKKHYGIK